MAPEVLVHSSHGSLCCAPTTSLALLRTRRKFQGAAAAVLVKMFGDIRLYIFGRLSTSCANDIVSAFFHFTREAVGFLTVCANEIVSAYSTAAKEPGFLGVMAQGVISNRDVFLFMLYRERTEMWHGRFHWRQPLLHDQSKYGPDETSEEQLLPVL